MNNSDPLRFHSEPQVNRRLYDSAVTTIDYAPTLEGEAERSRDLEITARRLREKREIEALMYGGKS